MNVTTMALAADRLADALDLPAPEEWDTIQGWAERWGNVLDSERNPWARKACFALLDGQYVTDHTTAMPWAGADLLIAACRAIATMIDRYDVDPINAPKVSATIEWTDPLVAPQPWVRVGGSMEAQESRHQRPAPARWQKLKKGQALKPFGTAPVARVHVDREWGVERAPIRTTSRKGTVATARSARRVDAEDLIRLERTHAATLALKLAGTPIPLIGGMWHPGTEITRPLAAERPFGAVLQSSSVTGRKPMESARLVQADGKVKRGEEMTRHDGPLVTRVSVSTGADDRTREETRDDSGRLIELREPMGRSTRQTYRFDGLTSGVTKVRRTSKGKTRAAVMASGANEAHRASRGTDFRLALRDAVRELAATMSTDVEGWLVTVANVNRQGTKRITASKDGRTVVGTPRGVAAEIIGTQGLTISDLQAGWAIANA